MPQQRRSPGETVRNIGLWLFMIAVGLSFIILGFQGRVGSGLAAFFAPSALAPMNSDGTAQPPATNPVGKAAATGVLGQKGVNAATTGVLGPSGVSAAIGGVLGQGPTKVAQAIKNLEQSIANAAAAVQSNPTTAAQASQSGLIQGFLRALGL